MSGTGPSSARRGVCFCLARARPPPQATLEAGLRAELSALRIRALKARAREAGVSEALLAEAEDADDMKQAVVDLVLAASGGGGGGGGEELQLLRRELAPRGVCPRRPRDECCRRTDCTV